MKFLISIVLLTLSAFGATPTLKADHVEVQLITPQKSLGPDGSLKVGFLFKLERDWHVYWKNPGDSGATPKFNVFQARIQEIHYPFPKRISLNDLTNYGYETEVLYPIDLVVDPGIQNIKFDLEWLVCKIECLPGFGELSLSLPRASSAEFKPPEDEQFALYDSYQEKVPKFNDDWNLVVLKRSDTEWLLRLSPLKEVKVEDYRDFQIFPENGESFQTKAPEIQVGKRHVDFKLPISINNPPKDKEAFVIVAHDESGKQVSFRQLTQTKEAATSFITGVLLALLGGLILNLMPCVFPVLSLKIFGFLKEPEVKKIRRSAWAYTFGSVLTFTLIGVLLAVLRSLGESIGWGFQLQKPWLVYLLALLFYFMALNFFGFFEVGNNMMALGGRLGKRRYLSGDFGTGVLAVIVASPCTAPFMGSALGLTLLLPIYQSLIIFSFLGIGMALPMILLAYWPKLISMMPKSGPWMVTLKQFMTFPLLLTSLWLLWVLYQQKGAESVFLGILSFVIATMMIWMIQISKKRFWRLTLPILLTAFLGLSVYGVQRLKNENSIQNLPISWNAFDPQLVVEKRKSEIVFIDFTASWCISCQVNKKAVLETADIEALFKKHQVFLVRADWTNLNPVITKALEELGRNSIPLYVVYNKSDKPILFPEVLTKDMLIRYFEEGVIP